MQINLSLQPGELIRVSQKVVDDRATITLVKILLVEGCRLTLKYSTLCQNLQNNLA